MSDPKNQRADGCSVFFTLLGVIAVSLIFIWMLGFFQGEQAEDVSQMKNQTRLDKIKSFTKESSAYERQIDAFHSEKNSSLEKVMGKTVSNYQTK